jgi:hypothetical protein
MPVKETFPLRYSSVVSIQKLSWYMNSLNNFKVDWFKIGTFAIGISKIDKYNKKCIIWIHKYLYKIN